MTEDRGLCWNAKMVVTVFADHPNNVLTIRVDWGYFILPPDWPKSHPAVFWLASSSPWGHTWTRGIGHVTWCLVLPLTAARNATLYRDNFISSIPWWHSPNIDNIANIVTPRVLMTPRFKVHYPPFLSRQWLYWSQSRSLTPVFARSYHPQHQNVQSSIKSQR